MRQGLVVAILLLMCLGVQLSGLMGQEHLKGAEAARELLAGGPWITPTSLYVPEPSIAPLPVWLAALLQSITGPTLWSGSLPGLLALALLAWHWHRTGQGKQAFYLLTMPLGLALALVGGAWALGLALVAVAIQQSIDSHQQSIFRSGLAAGLAALCIGLPGLLLPLLTRLIVSLRKPVLTPRSWLVWLTLALAPLALWLVAVGDGAFALDYLLPTKTGLRDGGVLAVVIVLGTVLLFGLVPWNLPAALRLRRGWWAEPWPAAALVALLLVVLLGQLLLLLWLPFAVAGWLVQPVAQPPRVHRPTQGLLILTSAAVIGGLAYGIWIPQFRQRLPDADFDALALAQRGCDCYLTSIGEQSNLRLSYHARVPYLRSQPGSGQPREGFQRWLRDGDLDAPAVWIVTEAVARRLRESPGIREVARRGVWIVLRRAPTGPRGVAQR